MSNLKDKLKYAAETLKDVVSDTVKGEDILISEEEANKRLKVCETGPCEFYVKSSSGSPRCNECGCFMKLKTQLKSAKCPLGKW